MRMEGRVAVVTGASRGIGRAIAAAFEAEGAAVAGCARGQASPPPGRLMLVCDVRSADAVAGFAAAVMARLGPPDVLVNNAGVVARGALAELSEAAWDEVVDANLKGTFLVTRAFLPAMRARRGGRIINIASISGRQGTAEMTAYCAAKHGVVGFTRSLADEVRGDQIAVNAICPGSVDTDMLRLGRPGAEADMTPAEIATVAVFLAAEAPPALTGSCIDVFG